jgi:hypothetical protein
MKSSLNSVVSIIGRIKEMNDVYQLLAPVNTGLAKSYSDDREIIQYQFKIMNEL